MVSEVSSLSELLSSIKRWTRLSLNSSDEVDY